MTQCANPVCDREAEYTETIDTSYMDHVEGDTNVINTCPKHVDPTNKVEDI